MEINFVHPTLEDRDWINKYYQLSGCRACECSFVNLYLWGRGYGKVAVVEDYLVQFMEFNNKKFYTFPAGDIFSPRVKTALEALHADAEQHGHKMCIAAITDARKARLQELFPDKYKLVSDRDRFDYVYDINALADLTGKKYQPKRNHINKFEAANPDWTVEIITEDNIQECVQMADDWFTMHEGGESSDAIDYHLERIAMGRAFASYVKLGMDGMLLRTGGRVVAFTMGNCIQPDTYDVNFEKAFPDVQGAYPMINREFARYIRSKYPEMLYLNREDDMGLPGLRKAKESYHPVMMIEKTWAEFYD